ncbi:hypothetical protein NPIL_228541 [Nephila pilipes]|uniref:Uncharacterized protein n=1 Tax=Nephila pilipes TaxID=299642 RepID=A0A8X6PLD6_NEPPI|nr:hypothetical protein NPIL_228541 [Nephila pilipes]
MRYRDKRSLIYFHTQSDQKAKFSSLIQIQIFPLVCGEIASICSGDSSQRMNGGCDGTGDPSGLPSLFKTLCQQGQAFKRPVCSPSDSFPEVPSLKTPPSPFWTFSWKLFGGDWVIRLKR